MMDWKVPLFDLHFENEEKEAVLEVLDSNWISAGHKTKVFEDKFAKQIGAVYAVAVNSGTAALHLAVLSLHIGPGDEVIVPSFTFAATVNAVKYTGAKPVFADIISREDLTISPADIQKKITERTKAIIVMHYAGFACHMDEILAIAGNHQLAVIEDAAHAPAATYHGKMLGTLGTVGAFSFYSNKNITTAEGGMVVTNNSEIANLSRLLRSHGMTASSYDRAKGHAATYDISQIGYNYRIDDIRASIGIVQLGRLSEDLKKRRVLAHRYHELLTNIGGITIPFQGRLEESSNYIFPIVLNENCRVGRDNLRKRLETDFKIQTSVHYQAVHKFTHYLDSSVLLPVTEYVADHEVTLPLYYHMTMEKLQYVASSLKLILADEGVMK